MTAGTHEKAAEVAALVRSMDLLPAVLHEIVAVGVRPVKVYAADGHVLVEVDSLEEVDRVSQWLRIPVQTAESPERGVALLVGVDIQLDPAVVVFVVHKIPLLARAEGGRGCGDRSESDWSSADNTINGDAEPAHLLGRNQTGPASGPTTRMGGGDSER